VKKLEIARSDEWKELLKDLEARIAAYSMQVVIKARTGTIEEVHQAVGKHDGFKEAIAYLERLGGK
jgi:hypothetical protein